MSYSPPPRRLAMPTSTSKHEEDLINAYEAEEERLVNIISRKLEKLREEKIDLENVLEAESESHVNRLSRELTALRIQQQQLQLQQQQQQANGNGSGPPEALAGPSGSNSHSASGSALQAYLNGASPRLPTAEVMLDAMRRENEELRSRLAETEQAYIRASRMNDIYREELIEHRRKLGISVDNLIGMASHDPYSQSTHRRASSNTSPSTSTIPVPGYPARSSVISVPIPRPPSQIHRPSGISSSIHDPSSPSSHHPHHHPLLSLSHPHHPHHSHAHYSHSSSFSSMGTTPSYNDSPDSASPFPISPVASTNPASYVSSGTTLTTPPSSASLTSNPPAPFPLPPPSLSYPSVPPPSLSSSFGSPSVSFHIPPTMANAHAREASSSSAGTSTSNSPVDPLSRRNSIGSRPRRSSFERRLGGISEAMIDASDGIPITNTNTSGGGRGRGDGSWRGLPVRSGSSSRSRGHSYERGSNGRVAESGSLLNIRAGRSRAASDAVPEQDPLEGESMPLG